MIPLAKTETEPALDLAEVFRQHHERVYRAAYRVTGSTCDAEDVLQTVFLRLARRQDNSTPISHLPAYLHRAAVNAALDLVRGRVETVELEYAPAITEKDPVNARELRARLRQAITRLSSRAAEIFCLRYFEGLDNPEIGDLLGITANEVSVSLHRSRARLKEELRSFQGGSL